SVPWRPGSRRPCYEAQHRRLAARVGCQASAQTQQLRRERGNSGSDAFHANLQREGMVRDLTPNQMLAAMMRMRQYASYSAASRAAQSLQMRTSYEQSPTRSGQPAVMSASV